MPTPPSPEPAAVKLSAYFPRSEPAAEEANEARYVYQHNRITFSRQQSVSPLAKRILARVLSQIDFGEKALRPVYELSIQELVDGTSLDADNAYHYAKSAVRELASVCWEIEDEELREWTPRHLLDTTLPKASSSGVTGGRIRVVLNPELAPYFVNLACNFTRFELQGYMELSSFYSMRLYEMLSSFRNTGWWKVSVAELREYVNCAPELDRRGNVRLDKQGKPMMKYPRASHLIQNVVLIAQRDLAKTPLAFEFTEITKSEGRGRPTAVALEFRLLHPTAKKATLPAHVLQDATAARLIARLESYQVDRANIAAYWDTIPHERMWALLKTWRQKQDSSQKIQNLSSYCNYSFVQEGKKWEAQKLEQQKDATVILTQFFADELPTTTRPNRTKKNGSGGKR